MADYEFNPGEIVTAVNRTSQPVSWRFNGQQFTLAPNQRKPMNMVYALAGVRQNPIMGTYDPAYEHQHDSLVGIAELEDRFPTTPTEQSACPEAIDRRKLPEDRQKAFIEKTGWDGQERLLAARADLPQDAGFAGVMPEK